MATAWHIVHVIYSSPAARLRIVTRELPIVIAGLAPSSWFVVDVPLELAGITGPGLEIACQHAADETLTVLSVSEWITAQMRERLVVAAASGSLSLILQPKHFFHDQVALRLFADALSVITARSVRILCTAATAGQPLADHLVREAMGEIYAALFPTMKKRREALARHGTWLAAAAAPHLAAPRRQRYRTSLRLADAEGGRPRAGAKSGNQTTNDEPLVPLPGRSDAIAALSALTPETLPLSATVWASTVARLAHIQAMQLWGPERPDALEREIAIVRDLARSLQQDAPPGSSADPVANR